MIVERFNDTVCTVLGSVTCKQQIVAIIRVPEHRCIQEGSGNILCPCMLLNALFIPGFHEHLEVMRGKSKLDS